MSATKKQAEPAPLFTAEEDALFEAIRLFVGEQVDAAKTAATAATTAATNALAERLDETEGRLVTVQQHMRRPTEDAQAFAKQAKTAAAEATDAASIARSWAASFLVSRARALT